MCGVVSEDRTLHLTLGLGFCWSPESKHFSNHSPSSTISSQRWAAIPSGRSFLRRSVPKASLWPQLRRFLPAAGRGQQKPRNRRRRPRGAGRHGGASRAVLSGCAACSRVRGGLFLRGSAELLQALGSTASIAISPAALRSSPNVFMMCVPPGSFPGQACRQHCGFLGVGIGS